MQFQESSEQSIYLKIMRNIWCFLEILLILFVNFDDQVLPGCKQADGWIVPDDLG
jgi:hypothetical protein